MTDTNTANWITWQYLSIPRLYHVFFLFFLNFFFFFKNARQSSLSFVSVLIFTDLYYSSSYTHPLSTGILLVTGHKYSSTWAALEARIKAWKFLNRMWDKSKPEQSRNKHIRNKKFGLVIIFWTRVRSLWAHICHLSGSTVFCLVNSEARKSSAFVQDDKTVTVKLRLTVGR